MNTLYESEDYVVLQHLLPAGSGSPDAPPAQAESAGRPGFEIVDKTGRTGVFLAGPGALLFQQQLESWKRHQPTQDEVESTLARYSGWAPQPLVLH